MYIPYVSKLLFPGVWEITDTPVEGFPYSVDMYLIEGNNRALLIDAGESKADLIGYITKLTEKPVDLLITHGHPDHAAGIASFDRVYLSHKDIDILNDLFGFHLDTTMVIDLTGTEVFDLGDCTIEVITLPGHTYGTVVLLDRKRQLLFSSDGLGSGSIWMQLPHSEPIETYLLELHKLEKIIEDMNDLKLLVGHDYQKPHELGKQYISDLRSLAEKILCGEITGTPTIDQSELTGGLTASFGQMKGFVYKPDNIFMKPY